MKTKINLLGHCCITLVLLIGLIGCVGNKEQEQTDEKPVHSEEPSKRPIEHGHDDLIEYEELDGSPHEASLLSISESRPAEAIIEWKYYAGDGCSGAREKTVQRDGNTIYLTIIASSVLNVHCAMLAHEVKGQFTVKNLEVGEYVIKGMDEKSKEFGRFRIE